MRTKQALFDSGRGYRFAALPEPSASVVWLDVRYPVGLVDDPPDKPGLAHLVEHLLFDVEVERDGRKSSIDAELRRLTMGHNAVTTMDSTTYRTVFDPRALGEVLAIEAERIAVGCAGLTPESFARERAVVMSELQTTRSPAGTAIERVVHETVYPKGHPYRLVETAQSVSTLELADACSFLAGPYQRGPAIVVASGATDHARLAQAARAFERLPVRAPAPVRKLPPTKLSPDITHRELAIQDPLVIALWMLPQRGSRALRALGLVWPLIPAYINDKYPGYSAKANLVGGASAPMLAVTLTLHSDSESFAAMDAVKESVAAMLRFLESPNGPDANWTTLWQRHAALVLADWDSLDQRSKAFADYLQFEHGTDYLSERMAELSTMVPSYADVPARLVLGGDRAHFVVLESTSGVHGSEDRTADHGDDRAYASSAEGAEEHEVRVDPESADQPLPLPGARPARHIVRQRFSNGLSVVLWPDGATPLVRGTLVMRSGWANEPLGQEGIARLFGGGGSVTPDHIVIDSAPRMVSKSDELARLLANTLRSDLHLTLRAGSKKRIHDEMVRRQALAKYDLDQRVALYGPKHAYARSPMTDGSLAMIDDNALKSWADRHMVGSNATLVITGQFDPNQLKNDIIASTRLVRNAGRSLDVKDTPRPTQAWIAGKLDQPRSSLQLEAAFVGGRGIDADHAKRLVLETVLREKLFELRAHRALFYVSWATYEPRRAGGLWSLALVVDAARAAEAGDSLAQLLDQLRRDPESYRAAFVLARQKVLERLLASSGSSRQVLAQFVEIVRFDLDEASYDRIAAQVAGLTLTTFHPFVARELAQTGQVFGAIGNAAGVDAALDAARHTSNAR